MPCERSPLGSPRSLALGSGCLSTLQLRDARQRSREGLLASVAAASPGALPRCCPPPSNTPKWKQRLSFAHQHRVSRHPHYRSYRTLQFLQNLCSHTKRCFLCPLMVCRLSTLLTNLSRKQILGLVGTPLCLWAFVPGYLPGSYPVHTRLQVSDFYTGYRFGNSGCHLPARTASIWA